MDLDDHLIDRLIGLDPVVEDAHAAVHAATMMITRVGGMLRSYPDDDPHRAALLADVEGLLQKLQRHDDRLSILTLALFQPDDPTKIH